MTADRFNPADTEEIVMKMIYQMFKDADDNGIKKHEIADDILVKLGKDNLSEADLYKCLHRLTLEGFISPEDQLGRVKMLFCGDLNFEEEY